MPPIVIFITFVGFGMTAYWLTLRWYYVPWMNTRTLYQALTPIALFHAFRYVGLGFLAGPDVAGAIGEGLTWHLALGDLTAAALALLAALALHANAGRGVALGLVWAFNLVGFADLTAGIARAMLLAASGEGMAGAGPWPYVIVGFYVPALLVTHLMAFALLLGWHKGPNSADTSGGAR